MSRIQTGESLWQPVEAQSPFITNLSHPVIRAEYSARLRELGMRYDEWMQPRERRAFDRLMVAKYGEQFPPPPHAVWLLEAFDILDAAEEQAERARRVPVTVRVCEPDEDLW